MLSLLALPSDCHDWRATPRLQSGVQEIGQSTATFLLANFCEGQVERDRIGGFSCKVRALGPSFTGIVDDSFHPEGVIYGHFLSPTSNDAVVSGHSAETHPLRWGGTLILTLRDGGWVPLSYTSGVITHCCRQAGMPDGREILLCEDEDGGMGHRFHFLYSVDLIRPSERQATSLVTADSYLSSCVDRRQEILNVTWQPDTRYLSVILSPRCGNARWTRVRAILARANGPRRSRISSSNSRTTAS